MRVSFKQGLSLQHQILRHCVYNTSTINQTTCFGFPPNMKFDASAEDNPSRPVAVHREARGSANGEDSSGLQVRFCGFRDDEGLRGHEDRRHDSYRRNRCLMIDAITTRM